MEKPLGPVILGLQMEPTTPHRNNVADLYSRVMNSLSPRVMQYPIPFPTFSAVLYEHSAELQQIRRDFSVAGVDCARSTVEPGSPGHAR